MSDSSKNGNIHHLNFFDNHGNVLPERSRAKFRVLGLNPAGVESFRIQEERALAQLRKKSSDLEKYIFLAWLRNTNLQLFYRLVLSNLVEITPLIYTPVVGEACLEYSNIYPFLAPPNQPDGLFISINQLNDLDEIIDNYIASLPEPDLLPQICVITDGSRILGLGDLGMNGMGIPVGKLQLYVAAAGLDPRRCLPVCLDFGTNNDTLREDPHYLGLRQKRPSNEEYYAAVDKVLNALHKAFPKMFIQFEDFSSEHAFELLHRYRENLFCFNDDIQGTGAVILSGFINAIEQASINPTDHKIVFLGAGSAGVGVAKQLMDYFIFEHHLSADQAKNMFWLVDSKGLVTSDRGDKLADHKVFFARDDNHEKQYKSLIDVIDFVKPTALIGLSSQQGAFNHHILKMMSSLNKRPIVFPLSNPASNAECTFEQAMEHTNNSVIFASGTAFPEYTIPESGKIVHPGQGNNMYIFPGLGLGAVLAKPSKITDSMIYAAAKSLSKSLNKEEIENQYLYPDLKRIREVSVHVAVAVCHQAVIEGLATDKTLLSLYPSTDNLCKNPAKNQDLENQKELCNFVKENMWKPLEAPH